MSIALRGRCQTLLPGILAAVLLLLAAACGGSGRDTPLIFAAASLADVLADAADAYQEQTGLEVEFNFGGSIALANQVARLGAPADGVILAGKGSVDLIVSAGVASRSDVVVIALNSLVVVSKNEMNLDSFGQLASGSRIAVADPDLAPAGQYAKEALVAAGIWADLEERIVPTLDVRAALAAVSSGSVDFAIVYSTDALTRPDLFVALTVDPALHQPVVYPAVAIAGSDGAENAAAFFQFLLGPDGQRILSENGFATR